MYNVQTDSLAVARHTQAGAKKSASDALAAALDLGKSYPAAIMHAVERSKHGPVRSLRPAKPEAMEKVLNRSVHELAPPTAQGAAIFPGA